MLAIALALEPMMIPPRTVTVTQTVVSTETKSVAVASPTTIVVTKSFEVTKLVPTTVVKPTTITQTIVNHVTTTKFLTMRIAETKTLTYTSTKTITNTVTTTTIKTVTTTYTTTQKLLQTITKTITKTKIVKKSIVLVEISYDFKVLCINKTVAMKLGNFIASWILRVNRSIDMVVTHSVGNELYGARSRRARETQ